MAELKPCPFCGGMAYGEYVSLDVRGEGMAEFSKVKCATCKAQTNIYRFEEEAVYAWNRRANNG